MVLQDLFEGKGYVNIINKEDAIPFELSVNMFYDNEERIPQELKYLFISKTKDELFFVLDSRDQDISALCGKWDQKISAFMNFGSSNKIVIQKLKYNAVQIVLYEKPIADRSEEGSLNVTRKILMPCTFDDNGVIEIPDDEVVEIPFYLIVSDEFKKNTIVENKLKNCLPASESKTMDFLYEKRRLVQRREDKNKILKKNFKEEEYNKIKEWLNTNVNTSD